MSRSKHTDPSDMRALRRVCAPDRLLSSVVLAEIARQVGRRAPGPAPRRERRPLVYETSLGLGWEQLGELLYLEDLLEY